MEIHNGSYDQVPPRDYGFATNIPWFREKLVDVSIQQDNEGSYYHGMLNILADHTVGTYPGILGSHTSNAVNDAVEDSWSAWCENNSIGTAIRQIRRGAARTGLGIGIPYNKLTGLDRVRLGIKTICSTELRTPLHASVDDRVYNGIKYDKNWEIEGIYLEDETYYKAKDILLWYKQNTEGGFPNVPECGPALCLFPSIKRFLDATMRGKEFKASIPMAVTLDPMIYKPEDASALPKGAFKYEPGMVPTLPPGTKLEGINTSGSSMEDSSYIEMVIGASARCISMPLNLAMGSSRNSNMSSSQVDFIPWENKINIDRNDMAPVVRKIFRMWANMAVLLEDYLPQMVRSQMQNFPFSITYGNLFRHPDPVKNANAKLIDMVSGNSTLYRICTQQGLNPRREQEREARLLHITPQELSQIYLAGRTNLSNQILNPPEETEDEPIKEEKETSTSRNTRNSPRP